MGMASGELKAHDDADLDDKILLTGLLNLRDPPLFGRT